MDAFACVVVVVVVVIFRSFPRSFTAFDPFPVGANASSVPSPSTSAKRFPIAVSARAFARDAFARGIARVGV